MSDRYTHGHQTSVVAAHGTRSIANSAAYLEPHLAPGRTLLDVGCGPGSITAEFAQRLGRNAVLGVDSSAEVIELASERFGDSGASFAVMNGYSLELEDNSFDIAHAHQVLQHVADPVRALREMRRVVRPGGIVAVRDADYAGMHWAPHSPSLDQWLSVYRQVARGNGAEPDAGRHLIRWAREAGFAHVEPTAAIWLFADPQACSWWGSSWANRVVQSSFATQALEANLATSDDLDSMAAGWTHWHADEDAWFVVPHGQLICRVD